MEDLFNQVTEGFVPAPPESAQGVAGTKKKLVLIAVPQHVTAESLHDATIDGAAGELVMESDEVFTCKQLSAERVITAPMLDGDQKASRFTAPAYCFQVMQPLETTQVDGKQRNFIGTKPPPEMPDGLKVRYKLFGSDQPAIVTAKVEAPESNGFHCEDVVEATPDSSPTRKRKKKEKR